MPDTDVLVAGGGLAGLSLALQLKQQRPELDITVVERRDHPVPIAAHKVGESTVEIGAHYFANIIRQKKHLEQDQLRKFGLRFFFSGPENPAALCGYDELGISDYLPVNTYQIDRGIFENHLAREATNAGIRFLDDTVVRKLSLNKNGDKHTASLRNGSGDQEFNCRWLVDSSGRQALIKKQLDLAKPSQHPNASVWLRTSKSIDIDALGTDASWRQRCNGIARRLSTNHIMGPGYWFWLIPLSSGATSLGLVFDTEIHKPGAVRNFAGLLDWMRTQEPLMADLLADNEQSVMDYLALRNYSHSGKQVFSDDNWAITGEAGLFADPFYSPGSDFIAISNTLICSLINHSDENKQFRTRFLQQFYITLFSSTMSLFRKQYPGFGDRDLMLLKTTWDYCYYWSVIAYLFFADKLTDIDFLQAVQPDISIVWQLNNKMQKLFHDVGAQQRQLEARGLLLDHHSLAIAHHLKRQLANAKEKGSHKGLQNNIQTLQNLATVIEVLLKDSMKNKDICDTAGLAQLQT
ncbi:MAG: NAD(P)/FAD-dependent oxidoreductase, partial [Gammaproteobacteria bacterium]